MVDVNTDWQVLAAINKVHGELIAIRQLLEMMAMDESKDTIKQKLEQDKEMERLAHMTMRRKD